MGGGNRTLYTARDGLRGVSRNRDLGLSANSDYLPYANVAGRVSFVRGAAPQNLEAALGAVEAEVRRQEEARKAKALEILGQH